jgi:DNA-binding CsgD family transcriptional regulator
MVIPAPAFEPEPTLAAVAAERCTSLYGVPTMFVAELSDPSFVRHDLSSLRTGIMADAPCPVEVMKHRPVPVSDRQLDIMHRLVSQYRFELRVDEEVVRTVDDPELRGRIVALADRVRGPAAGGGSAALAVTPRELDVVTQVAAGLSNSDVAARIGLAPATVKSYLKSAMRKAGVHNRMALVTGCRRAGLIP